MFEAEADGLRHLAASGTIRVPEVVGWGGSGSGANPGWLLLEFIPRGTPGSDYGRHMGEGMARLHDVGPVGEEGENPVFGWHRDNFIGSLPQQNSPTEAWVSFWRDHRLEPQFRRARDHGHFQGGAGRTLERLLGQLDSVMEGAVPTGAALLHGDLWSGNYYPGPGGEPILIDPAVYRGAGEVDLAMMELFGSFPDGFLEGYENLRPLAPEYHAFRRDLYQLYYLLVHVNLFGGGYVGGSVAAAERALAGA
jgi:fructosamine-3-kinase